MELVIVNTGCANISSVRFAIERLGYKVNVSDNPAQINSADKVFLPGVGSAHAAMAQITEKGLLDTLKSLQQPTLGICLGMQLLATFSEEGDCPCLGHIDASVSKMEARDVRLPHMGWNQVRNVSNSPLFEGIADNEYFYFVHGFAVIPGSYTLAECDYGQPFSASIGNGQIAGVQFHPERSGKAGAKLLQNFIEMTV